MPHPVAWTVSLILLTVNAVIGVTALIAEGNVFSGLSMIICAACIWALNRQEIKARFHVRKEGEQ